MSQPFIIQNLRSEPKNADMWIFSLSWIGLDHTGLLDTHGWKYIVSSNQIRRPTARGFAGQLTNLDNATIEEVRAGVQKLIAYHGQKAPVRSIRQSLLDYYASEGSWRGAFNVIKTNLREVDALTVGQYSLITCAAVLADISEEELLGHVAQLEEELTG